MADTELLQRVGDLSTLRRTRDQLATELSARRSQFESDNAALLSDVKSASQQVDDAETALRVIALDRYTVDQVNAPCAGLSVKIFETLSYDATEAFAWAKRSQMALLPESLDKKAFEKIAKATTIAFVKYEKEPRVTIATDLDKALATIEAIV